MGRIGLAFRAFFAALSGKLTDTHLRLPAPADAEAELSGMTESAAPSVSESAPSSRSDALTLLASLQREARLVDLVQESLDGYSDQQVGAASRDVLRDCRKVLDRMFSLTPVIDQPEESEVETPAQFSNVRFRLSGSVQGEPPYRGKLIHPGWLATQCELPEWNGQPDDQLVVAPAEVELPK